MAYAVQNTLNGCISTLSTSVSLLNESMASLDAISDDFTRLGAILHQDRIFTLIPEEDLLSSKRSLESEVEPRVLRLVEAIRSRLAKLERRRDALVAKEQLNHVRISSFRSGNEATNIQGTPEEIEKLKELRLKKDRLKYKLASSSLQQRRGALNP